MSDFLTRYIIPIFGTILALVALSLAGDVTFYLGVAIFDQQALGIVLGLGLAIVFIAVPARGRSTLERTVPTYDAILALLATITGIYFAVRYPVLTNEFYFRQTETFIVGIILFRW